jgi:hypothetical protein
MFSNRSAAFIILLAAFIHTEAHSQGCATLNIQHQADIPSACNTMVMTMMHDNSNRPYLYVANKEGGLKAFDISTITSPSLVAAVPTTLFDTLDVMSLSQDGNYLYLALGNSFTNPQRCGMAIVDVTDPKTPTVTDYFVVPNSSSGGGIVKVEGNYAYLGAMQSGLVILDVTDKSNIQFVSQFVPSINFPPVPFPNPNYYNARGMEVRNSIVYLCYDGGGIRVINCTNKLSPKETGRWCNPVMYMPFDHPKAYNNIVLDDTLAYVAVDYCGMEVLSISDTSNIRLVGWWNPYNCPNNDWFTSPVHANEIQYNRDCKKVFLATGKSDLHVVDVSNPAMPDSCNVYGGVSNDIGTWGVGLYQDQIYLAYICVPLGYPFPSNWTGVKILTYTPCSSTGVEQSKLDPLKFSLGNNYPNPFNPVTSIEFSIPQAGDVSLRVYNVLGMEVATLINERLSAGLHRKDWNAGNLASGVYFCRLLFTLANDGQSRMTGVLTQTKKLVLLR